MDTTSSSPSTHTKGTVESGPEAGQALDPFAVLQHGMGELFFVGEPVAYSPIITTILRCRILGTAAAPHAATPPPCHRDATASAGGAAAVEEFARHLPIRPTAGLPQLFGATAEDSLRQFNLWSDGLRQIPATARASRSFWWTQSLADWLAHERASPQLEIRAMVALESFCQENLWREITVKINGAPAQQLFRTAAQFAQTALRLWGKSAEESRVSHMRRSARLYMRLRERGLPLPPRLSHLEEISRRDDAVDLYSDLVAFNRGLVPSPGQLAAAVRGGIRQLRFRKTLRHLSSQRQKDLLATTDKLVSHCAQYSDPLLQALVKKLQELTRDKAPVEAPPPPRLPTYPAGLPSPITVQEDGHQLTLRVAPLPHPMPYRARQSVKKYWALRERDGDQFEIVVALSANPAEAKHQRAEAFAWALDICQCIRAPLPNIPVQLRAPCM